MGGDTSGHSSEMEKGTHFFFELVFCPFDEAPLKQRIEMQKMMSSK